jgi:uncharacterized repeat protein (TIGR03803 family)
MTTGGGLYCSGSGCGTIFKIKTDGSGYIKLFDFFDSAGKWPLGSLIFNEEFLYGMTASGGTGLGVAFKIMKDGSGFLKILDFAGIGQSPESAFLKDGTYLYSMTRYGGIDGGGIIFKIKPDSTGYIKLFDFDTLSGTMPGGALISDGTYLYGMTSAGGTNGVGTIFKINHSGVDISERNIERDISIYPNPTSDKLYLESRNILNLEATFFDMIGRQIDYKAIGQYQKIEFDVSTLDKGVYFLIINNQEQSFVRKIIIQ